MAQLVGSEGRVQASVHLPFQHPISRDHLKIPPNFVLPEIIQYFIIHPSFPPYHRDLAKGSTHRAKLDMNPERLGFRSYWKTPTIRIIE
jgi:hypothetical protein